MEEELCRKGGTIWRMIMTEALEDGVGIIEKG
jgi:hypothetical protein